MELFGLNISFNGNGKRNPIVRQQECHKGQDVVKEAFKQRFDDFDKALDRRFEDMKDFIRNNRK